MIGVGSENLISIIIPTFNGERYIARALDSVLAQDYQGPKEIIVVDDGSTDATKTVVGRFNEVNYQFQSNQGVGAARNYGIKLSTGSLIAFLDQDDQWAPHKLSEQSKYLHNHPSCECVISHQECELEKEIERPGWLKPELIGDVRIGYFLGGALIRRSLFDKVGLFDTEIRAASDSDWFFRVKDAGYPIGIIEEKLLHRTIHRDNHSHQGQEVISDLLLTVRNSIRRKQNILRKTVNE